MVPNHDDIIVNGRVDLTRLPIPQVYFNTEVAEGVHPIFGLKDVIEQSDGIERAFQPTVSEDGVIAYPKTESEPDDIAGFRRDPDNRWRFIPMFEPCVYRLMGVRRKPNGCVQIRFACNHLAAKTFGSEVTLETCQGCVLKAACKTGSPQSRPTRSMLAERDFQQPTIEADGAMIYPKTGWEPPICPDGYHADPSNRWRFIPDWKPCADRTFDNTVRPCGCITVRAVCLSERSGLKGDVISYHLCEKCPVRREPETFQIK